MTIATGTKNQVVTGTLTRHTLTLSGYNLAARVVGFAGVVLMTRILGVAEYGRLAVAYAYWGLFALVAEAGLEVTIIREVGAAHAQVTQYIGNAMLLRGVYCAGLYLLALAILPMLDYDPHTADLARMALLMLFCSPLVLTRTVMLVGLEIPVVARLDMIAQLLTVVAVVMALGTGGQAMQILQWQLGATLLAQVGYIQAAWRRLPTPRTFHIDWHLWRLLIRHAMPILITSLLTQAQIHTTRLIIAYMLQPNDVAIYSVANNLTLSVNMLSSLYFSVAYPHLIRQANVSPQAYERLARNSFRLMLTMAMPLSLLIALSSSALIVIYAGANFLAAAPLLTVMAFSIVGYFMSATLYHLLLAAGQQRILPWVALVLAGVQTGLLVLLLPRVGGIGAAVATLAMYGVSLLIYLAIPTSRSSVLLGLREVVRPALATLLVAAWALLAQPRSLLLWVIGPIIYGLTLAALYGPATMRQVWQKIRVSLPYYHP